MDGSGVGAGEHPVVGDVDVADTDHVGLGLLGEPDQLAFLPVEQQVLVDLAGAPVGEEHPDAFVVESEVVGQCGKPREVGVCPARLP